MALLEIYGYIPKEVRENRLHILLERNVLIVAVINRMKTQIMGYHGSKMYYFLPLKRLRTQAKILKMRILS